MRLLVCFLLLFALVCVDGRGGGIRIRFSGRSIGRMLGRSGGGSSGGGRSGGGRSGGRPRGKGGWFTSSGTRKSSRSVGAVYSRASYSRLRNDVHKEGRKTNFGTKFGYHKIPTSKKMFGLGVGAGFLGGSGYGYAATLASYTIYHRYLFLMAMLHSNGYKSVWDREYHEQYYERNKCLDGCHPWSHCEWGICECKEGFEKVWGRCSKKGNTQPVLGSQASSQSCSNSEECWRIDINLVCEGQGGHMSCNCRKDMAWNSKLLECQIFLDVNCQDFNEEMWPSRLVQQAANIGKEEESVKIRKEQEEKCSNAKRKCVDESCQEKANLKIQPHLKWLRDQINKNEIDIEEGWKRELETCGDENCKRQADYKWDQFQQGANCSRMNIKTASEGVSKYPGECGENSFEFMRRFYNEDTKCSGLEGDRISVKGASWMMKTNKCKDKICEMMVNGNCKRYCEGHKLKYEAPDKRTETKNESLANSLLIHIKDSHPKEKDLVEAFCRDVDSFNLAFQDPGEVWRPSQYCKPVPDSFCAVAYDSHDCYAGWSLNITDGAQLSFGIFSSKRCCKFWKFVSPFCFAGMTLTLWGLKLVASSLVFQTAAFREQILAFMQR